MSEGSTQKKSIAERRPEMTRWKKVLLAVAGVFCLVGVGLGALSGGGNGGGGNGGAGNGGAGNGGSSDELVADSQGGGEKGSSPSTGASPNTFLPGGASKQSSSDPDSSYSTTSEEPEGAGATDYSPFFLKSGFSFFVAFCVGFAARIWMKMAVLGLGTLFLALFLLSYAGAIEVEWTTLKEWWDAVAARVKDEASSFQSFVTGSLPQAGMAGLGLVTGFKKK